MNKLNWVPFVHGNLCTNSVAFVFPRSLWSSVESVMKFLSYKFPYNFYAIFVRFSYPRPDFHKWTRAHIAWKTVRVNGGDCISVVHSFKTIRHAVMTIYISKESFPHSLISTIRCNWQDIARTCNRRHWRGNCVEQGTAQQQTQTTHSAYTPGDLNSTIKKLSLLRSYMWDSNPFS